MENTDQLQNQPGKNGSAAPWLAMAVLLEALVIVWHCLWPDAITGDVAMYLQCGQLILAGQTPFIDLVDVNPPLIMLLNIFPAMLAHFCGLPLELAGNLFMGLTSIAITVFTAYLLKEILQAEKARFFGPVLLSGAVINALVTYDFGQREHFFALIWLPFFFLRWGRYQGDVQAPRMALAIICGTLFGIGLALKLFFLFIVIGCEVYWQVSSKQKVKEKLTVVLSPENLAATAVMIFYGIYLWLMPAAAGQCFFKEVMPLLISAYSAFNVQGFSMASVYWWPALVLVVVSLVVAACCRPPRSLTYPIVVSLLAGIVLVEFQHKGWTYHGISMLLSALLLLFLSLAQKIGNERRRFYFLSALAALFVCGANLWLSSVHQRLNTLTAWQNNIGNYARAGDCVLYLDTSDCPWFVYSARAGFLPGSRYLWLFNLPMWEYKRAHIDKTGQGASTEEMAANTAIDRGVQAIVSNIAADVQMRQPSVVLCRFRNCFAMPKQFNLLEYLRKNGLENSLESYEEQERINDFVVFKKKAGH